MTEDARRRVEELLLELWNLEPSAQQVQVAEEAVRLADGLGDVALGFQAREALVEAATFSGFPEKALVAFTWCLGQCDREPERFREEDLLWEYKWVAADLPFFPQIPRARIEAIHADMEARYRRCGKSLQPIHKVRWLAALRMGQTEAALEYYERARATPRDDGSDCAACELDDEVVYHIARERYAEAATLAQPIVEGTMSCASVPHVTLAALLRPLLELERNEEALRLHRWGYRLVAGKRKFVDANAEHVEFLALTGNLARGVEALQASLPGGASTTDLDDRYRLLSAGCLLLRALAEADPAAPHGLRLPAGLLDGEGQTASSVAALAEAFERAALALADRFDARNGNDAYRAGHARRLLLLGRLGRDLPLGD
jgi:hypothetical protein